MRSFARCSWPINLIVYWFLHFFILFFYHLFILLCSAFLRQFISANKFIKLFNEYELAVLLTWNGCCLLLLSQRRYTLFTPPNQMCVSLIYWCCCCCWRYDANPTFFGTLLTHSHSNDQNVNINQKYPWLLRMDFIPFKLKSPTTNNHDDDIHALYFVVDVVASSIFLWRQHKFDFNLCDFLFPFFPLLAHCVLITIHFFSCVAVAVCFGKYLVTFLILLAFRHARKRARFVAVNGRWLIKCHNERQ